MNKKIVLIFLAVSIQNIYSVNVEQIRGGIAVVCAFIAIAARYYSTHTMGPDVLYKK